MKKALFLLLFACSLLTAAETRTLENITYRSQIGNTIGLIKLSDGSIWKWTPDAYSENLLRKWSEGDEIIIRVVNQPGHILQNLSRPYYTPSVSLSFESYTLFPYIVNFSENRMNVTLSDGTQWQVLYDFTQRTLLRWDLEDRIIPVRGVKDNYELLNLDIPYGNRCQIERSVQVIKLET